MVHHRPHRSWRRRRAEIARLARALMVPRRLGGLTLLAAFTVSLFGLPVEPVSHTDAPEVAAEAITAAPAGRVTAVKSCCSRKVAAVAVGCACPPERRAAGTCCCVVKSTRVCCGKSHGSQIHARRATEPPPRVPALSCPCGRHATPWGWVGTEPRLLPAAVVVSHGDGPMVRLVFGDDHSRSTPRAPDTPPPRPAVC